MGRKADINQFYKLVSALESRLGGKRTLGECHGRMDWPSRGAYFFFEPGEFRANGKTPKVVRVGTHALKKGAKSTLWKRLRQHRGTTSKKNPFGGNHRGSVFRKHIGFALINRGKDHSLYPKWGVTRSTNSAIRKDERSLENEVSKYIRKMPFLWLEINDCPGPKSDRGYIERNAISLLSNWNKLGTSGVIDPPSSKWLGLHCKNEKVVKSGLWNSNHVNEEYDREFLKKVSKYIQKM